MSILMHGKGITTQYAMHSEQVRVILDLYTDTMHLAVESELVPTLFASTSQTLCGFTGDTDYWQIMTSIRPTGLGDYHNACQHCLGVLTFREMSKT